MVVLIINKLNYVLFTKGGGLNAPRKPYLKSVNNNKGRWNPKNIRSIRKEDRSTLGVNSDIVQGVELTTMEVI